MYIRPAEWQKNKTIYMAWPYDENLWGADLKECQKEFVALIMALKQERLVVLCPDEEQWHKLASLIGPCSTISFMVCAYADIWLRDIMPIAVRSQQNHTASVIPVFNGWGQKYLFAKDKDLAHRIALGWGDEILSSSLVFEGGAIECNGQGTLLTTEQCLLNKNRNPLITKQAIEKEFLTLFGAKKVIWLKEGLKNDHTDGHIDTLARFIAPNKIAIMTPTQKDDPNFDVLTTIKEQLLLETDAYGHHFELVELPSVGRVVNSHGDILPASFLNFIIGDHTMAVPIYDTAYDDRAVDVLKKAVDLKVVGLRAQAILTGGGAFHCISQEYFE